MAEVTVSQLAKTVGATVDRLLAQMKEAGLDHESGDQTVSDVDKQKLLAHLKNSHGASAAQPKKITLKRRTIGTVKTAGSAGGKKTVAIEVRKKRTYVKREESEAEEALETTAPAEADTSVADVTEISSEAPLESLAEGAVETVDAAEEASSEAPVTEESAVEGDSEAPKKRVDPFDVEELRRRAATKRKEQEDAEKARHKAMLQSKAEQAAREKAEEAARLAKAKLGDAGKKQFRTAGPGQDDDDPLKKPGKKKGRKGAKSNKSGKKGFDEFLVDDRQQTSSLGGQKVLQAISKQEFTIPTEKITHEVRLPDEIAVSDLA